MNTTPPNSPLEKIVVHSPQSNNNNKLKSTNFFSNFKSVVRNTTQSRNRRPISFIMEPTPVVIDQSYKANGLVSPIAVESNEVVGLQPRGGSTTSNNGGMRDFLDFLRGDDIDSDEIRSSIDSVEIAKPSSS